MRYKNTIEAIYISLDEIQRLIARVGADDSINAIDIDLAADKLRHVYDLVLQLKIEKPVESTLHRTSVEEPSGIEETRESKIVEEHQEQSTTFEIEIEPGQEKVSVREGIEHPVKSGKPEGQKEEKAITRAQIDSRVKPSGSKKFLSDTFEGKSRSLNDELSNKTFSGNLTDKLSSKPISSISSAIGLNEKFEIINNLFDGNSQKYEHTMQVLNTASNFNEAYGYMSKNLGWDMDDHHVQRILELIRRKLIVKKNDN